MREDPDVPREPEDEQDRPEGEDHRDDPPGYDLDEQAAIERLREEGEGGA